MEYTDEMHLLGLKIDGRDIPFGEGRVNLTKKRVVISSTPMEVTGRMLRAERNPVETDAEITYLQVNGRAERKALVLNKIRFVHINQDLDLIFYERSMESAPTED